MAEKQVRLLACGKCRTVEVLDDYTGPPERAEDYDVVLNVAVSKHQDGVERIPHAPAALVRLKQSEYDNDAIREQVVERIQASFGGGETGLGAAAYALRDNFRADAMACFAQHNRNPACSDYKADHKRLVPDTAGERRELGVAPAKDYDKGNPALTKYLCEYCPVHSLVVQAKRDKAGLYDK